MSVPVDRDRSIPTRTSPFLELVSDNDVDELASVLEASRALFSAEAASDVVEVTDYPSATSALEMAWQAITAALAGAGAVREQVMASDGLLDLLQRVRRLDVLLREAESTRRQNAMNVVRTALGRFQSVDSTRQLIELAPEVVCSLGFDRAIVSRIQDSMWVTQAVHIAGDAEWAKTIEAVGRENPQQLGPALRETEMVRRRMPMLVTDVQTDRNVHRPVADASLSRSYVAAPVMLRNSVVGFLHADRYFHRGDTDVFDRDVLAMFAEGLTYALERTVLLGRLDSMRRDVRRMVGGLESLANGHAGADTTSDIFDTPVRDSRPDIAPASGGHEVPRFGDLASRLTRREQQVVALMAGGETNARIASRLVLSEATVKSHVKHILRKLGAANRAEAVSKWLLAAGAARSA